MIEFPNRIYRQKLEQLTKTPPIAISKGCILFKYVYYFFYKVINANKTKSICNITINTFFIFNQQTN